MSVRGVVKIEITTELAGEVTAELVGEVTAELECAAELFGVVTTELECAAESDVSLESEKKRSSICARHCHTSGT